MTGKALNYEEIGNRIRQAREEQGLSQGDLAAKLGFSRTAINYYENGKRRIAIDDLYILARALGKPLSFFLGDAAEPPAPAEALREVLESKVADFLPVKRIPLLGTIRAGEPLFAEQNLEGEITVPKELTADFALRVKGDSMAGAGIVEGDIVVCKKACTASPGDIVVALVNTDEVTVKYLVEDQGQWLLRAATPGYPDVKLREGEDRIQGVVVEIVRKPPKPEAYQPREPMMVAESGTEYRVGQEWIAVISKARQAGLSPEALEKVIEAIGSIRTTERDEAATEEEEQEEDTRWKRVLEMGIYIFRKAATLEEAARAFGVSVETAREDMEEALPRINPELARKVKEVLEYRAGTKELRRRIDLSS